MCGPYSACFSSEVVEERTQPLRSGWHILCLRDFKLIVVNATADEYGVDTIPGSAKDVVVERIADSHDLRRLGRDADSGKLLAACLVNEGMWLADQPDIGRAHRAVAFG